MDWRESRETRLRVVLAKPWFLRLWVVQEVVLARDSYLMFGRATIPLSPFLKLGTMALELREIWLYWHELNNNALRNLFTMRSFRGERPGALECIKYSSYFDFSDPRDRLYALLGMIDCMGFVANYDLGTEEVFRTFATWALEKFSHYKALSFARGASLCDCKIPSWAPCHDMNILHQSMFEVTHFNACGGDVIVVAEKVPDTVVVGGELLIKVGMVDQVYKKSFVSLTAGIRAGDTTEFFTDASTISKYNSLSPADDRWIRFWTALTFGVENANERASREYVSLVKDYFTTRVPNYSSRTPSPMEEYSARRCFSTTTSGRFAWIPQRAEPEDKFCIIYGARLPFVLRLLPCGKYRLVGECWIEGLMEGEALSLPGFKWEDISLI